MADDAARGSAPTPRDPAWDDSACQVDEYAEGRFVVAPETRMFQSWVSVAGEIADGARVAGPSMASELPEPADGEDPLEGLDAAGLAMIERLLAGLGLGE